MTFKELRPNNPIHLLDKSKGIKYILGKVLNVGQPRLDTQPMPGQQGMSAMQLPSMVVDVTIEANGKTETYKLDENATVAAVSTVLISIDKEGIIREVDATIAHCEQYFADKENMEKTYEQSKQLKSELDSAFKEKQETENRFKKLEESQAKQGDMLKEILGILKKDNV